ncbi:hypothetical protein TMRO357_00744 [Alteriqipengyuania sp. 357]
MAAASRSSSASMAQSKAREAERYSREVETAHNERAKYATDIARKGDEIARLRKRIADADLRQQKERERIEKKLAREQENRLRALEVRSTPSIPGSMSEARPHDVFISHAWEDKEGFVRELAEKCHEVGVDAWYDETAVKWGQSLRQAIDRGLANAYFGVVILSENFFKKQWTNYELDGLLQKESSGSGAVLPIWHKVTKDEVESFSPSLANRLALNTAIVTVDEIVDELKRRVDELRPI